MGPSKIIIGTVLLLNFVNIAKCISVEKDLSLTFSQKQTLDKFRQRVKPLLQRDHMKTDLYLIRFLRAVNFDTNMAANMLKQNLKWRQQNKMDQILQEDWSDIQIVGVIDIWDWDIRRAVIEGKGQRLLRYMDYLLENITMQVFERQGKGLNVTQWTVLANVDGFNLITHGCPICIPLWIQFVQSVENNYHGYLHELIAIEAPATINVILEAIKPFLSRPTREAFRIFGPNKSKWLPYLDERVDRSQRRAAYGGTHPF